MCINDGQKIPVNWKGILIVVVLYAIFVSLMFALTTFVFARMGFANASEQAFVAGVSAFIGAVVAIMFDRIIKYLGL